MFSRSRFASLVSGVVRIAAILGLFFLAAPGFSQGLPNGAKLSIQVNGAPVVRSGASSSTIWLNASVVPPNASNKGLQWSSSNTAVATVDGTGLVTAVGVGTATITVRSLDGSFTDQCVVNVDQYVFIPVASVSIDPTTASVSIGASRTLQAIVVPNNATNQSVVWGSDNTSIATVDTQGIVTGVAIGTTNITATTVDGNFVSSCAVTVNNYVTSISLGSELNMPVLSRSRIIPTFMPSNASSKQVTFSSDNPAVASVDFAGAVIALSPGTANITCSAVLGNAAGNRRIVVRPVADCEWSMVSSGRTHTIALMSDGSVWVWGENTYGQLGLGDTVARDTPTLVMEVGSGKYVAASSDNSFVVKSDGSLYGCGRNNSNQVGAHSAVVAGGTANITTFTKVYVGNTVPQKYLAIYPGSTHVAALSEENGLLSWGSYSQGELGINAGNYTGWTAVNKNYNVRKAGSSGIGSNWYAVSAGTNFTITLGDGYQYGPSDRYTGLVYLGAGLNSSKQMFDGTATNTISPGATGAWNGGVVSGISPGDYGAILLNNVYAGDNYSIITSIDGSAWARGTNSSGQLGIGNTTTPVQTWTLIGTDHNWAMFSPNTTHTLAIRKNGALYASGVGTQSQIGDGLNMSYTTFTRVGSSTNWMAVSAGSKSSFGLTFDGKIYSWGENNGNSHLGRKNGSSSVSVPTLIDVPVRRIQFSSSSGTMGIGQNLQLLPTIFPSNATHQNLIYTSSDNFTAIVSSTGLVTAVDSGIATIHVSDITGKIKSSFVVIVE